MLSLISNMDQAISEKDEEMRTVCFKTDKIWSSYSSEKKRADTLERQIEIEQRMTDASLTYEPPTALIIDREEDEWREQKLQNLLEESASYQI